MAPRQRLLATGVAALVFVGCSALTSFDDFVGDGSSGSSGGTSGATSSSGTSGTSGASSGGTSSGGTSGTSGGTSGQLPADGGPDAPCVVRNTGPTRGNLALSGTGGVGWNAPASALVADATAASVSLTVANDDSALLLVTDFRFAIPTTASITGIRVFIVRRASGQDMRDEDVHLMSDNMQLGANKGAGDDLPVGAFASTTYGSGSDRWGIGQPTPANVNANTFGVAFRAGFHGDNGAALAEIDEIRVDVSYCE